MEVTAMRLMIPVLFFSIAALAEPPASKILYIGAIAISPCHDAKVLAEWYSRFGIESGIQRRILQPDRNCGRPDVFCHPS